MNHTDPSFLTRAGYPGRGWTIFGACILWLLHATLLAAAVYEVGPGKPLDKVGLVPWESLNAGDEVHIYWRVEPYPAKWVICQQGSEAKPIIIRGIPGPEGQLPVIDGRDAITRPQLNYWSDTRSVIKIGGANQPADTMPQYVVLENLDIRSARPPYAFTGRKGRTKYDKNASSIFIEKGEHITIRNCALHDSGNGLFTSYQSKDVLVEKCWIYDNGMEGSIYEHNSYTAAQGITFQFNRYGPLRKGCLGNNLKDRSAGLVVRYNWIEGGNRQLDLVDAEDNATLRNDPRYRDTWVYGNLLWERDGDGNNQIVHYGGDSGKKQWYRQGTLHFYNNTVFSSRSDSTMLFRLSSGEEQADCRDNIFYVAASGSSLAVLDGTGRVSLNNCWFKKGWVKARGLLKGEVFGEGSCLTGSEPGFVDSAKGDFRLKAASPSAAGGIPWGDQDYRLLHEYYQHCRSSDLAPLPASGQWFIGAFAPLR